jgi:hypothetical protein
MVGFLVVCLRGRLRQLRVGTLGQCLSGFRIHLYRAGIGLLYYGQNFLTYPSTFPAGSRREGAFTLCPLSPLS